MADYVRNSDEAIIVANMGCARLDNSNATKKRLLDLVGKWMFYVGQINVSADGMIILVQFIQENYSHLSADDIELAINLSLKGKLDCDIRTYGQFSPMYISTILNAYDFYRKEHLKSVTDRWLTNPKEPQSITKMTPKEEVDFYKSIIRDDYIRFADKGEVMDYFSMIYNFLKRTKRIILDKEMIDNAVKYGESMYIKMLVQERTEKLQGNFNMIYERDEDLAKKKYSRNYCVQEYFKKNNMDDVINSINLSDFV